MMKLVYVAKLRIEAVHALIQLKAAIKQKAHIARQYAVQHAVIHHADILEVQHIAAGSFLWLDLPRKHGALHHDPRHDGRKPQRNARHLTGIKRLQVWFDAAAVIVAEHRKIFVGVMQKLHGLIEQPGHKYHMRGVPVCYDMLANCHAKLFLYRNYTAVFLDLLLIFREHFNKIASKCRTQPQFQR